MHLSIITPNLNYGRFLGDCLESVAMQVRDSKERRNVSADANGTPTPGAEQLSPISNLQSPISFTIEHLIFDAGSTDDSAGVAAGFPHATWIAEPDRGMSHAINKGFDRATGDWVMWLNADDRLKPGALEEIVKLLAETDADVVYGGWNFIDEDGRFIRNIRVPRWSRFAHIHHHCLIGSTAAFYRKSTVIDVGHRLREDFKYVMDGEFYARLDAAGLKFEKSDFTVADFRLHDANASQRHLGKSREMDAILAAERQHIESRAIRRAYGITLFADPYLNGLLDGLLWIAAKGWKAIHKM
ncbi:MAG: glycosyltransferase family 2 protein [Luteolibacter sp.]|jgi:glycosyltransferase involved in cell wall biosynthesis